MLAGDFDGLSDWMPVEFLDLLSNGGLGARVDPSPGSFAVYPAATLYRPAKKMTGWKACPTAKICYDVPAFRAGLGGAGD